MTQTTWLISFLIIALVQTETLADALLPSESSYSAFWTQAKNNNGPVPPLEETAPSVIELPAATNSKWLEMTRRHSRQNLLLGKWRSIQAEINQFQVAHLDADISAVKFAHQLILRPKYLSDMDIYGLDDYWARPEEFFEYGGDCEDAAIAAYFLLKKLGWPTANLWIVISQDFIRNRTHAYLAVNANGDWYAIDQSQKTVRFLVSEIQEYGPLYVINEARMVIPRRYEF
jgi:hypothetical protein